MRAELERRLEELSRELRAYPTPIARCDEQLAALLDERSGLIQTLTTLGETGCSPLALWINDGGFHAA